MTLAGVEGTISGDTGDPLVGRDLAEQFGQHGRVNNIAGRELGWSGYHRRSRAETKMNCVKLLGQRLSAREFDRQVAEFQVRAAGLNGCIALGVPVAEAVGSVCLGIGAPRLLDDLRNRVARGNQSPPTGVVLAVERGTKGAPPWVFSGPF